MNKKNFFKFLLCTLTTVIIIIVLFAGLNYFSNREKEILAYADASNLYNVSFNLNGATKIDKSNLNCSDDVCTIILPQAYRNDGHVLGYSHKKDDVSPKYKIGDKILVNKDITFYVISYKENTLTIQDNNIDYLEKSKLTCKAYNKDTSCNVVIPSYNKIGYENKGYSTSSNSLTGYIYPGNNYKISKNVTLYPIYSYSNRLEVLNIRKTLRLDNTFIEIENTCDDQVANRYLGYLNNIKKEMPFLLIGNKVSLLGNDLFTRIWGSSYAGMNFGPKSLRSVDIRCSNIPNNDYYATMVHEMTHTWDFHYASKLDNNITSQNDIINLYNKYLNMDNRPFRDYSFSNIYEFFADAVKYYYFKYKVPTVGYVDLDYPDDIRIVIEKYICIAENNYNTNKCK